MNPMALLRWSALSGVLLLGAACVTQPQRIVGASGVRDAAELSVWTASGRMGVSGVAQAGSGGFTWNQQTDVSDVQLRGPVGIGSLLIHIEGQRLTLQASDGTQYDADQALKELELRLGAPVPVTQLRYWLLGLAAPGERSWSDPGTTLEQDGWQIGFTDWLQRDVLRLPGRIILTREQVRIVIVVQEWRLAA
jgi:outer membrane lipoprotein LolB